MEDLRLIIGGTSVHDQTNQFRMIMGRCVKEDTFFGFMIVFPFELREFSPG